MPNPCRSQIYRYVAETSASIGVQDRGRERHDDLVIDVARLEAGARSAFEFRLQQPQHLIRVGLVGDGDIDREADRPRET